MHRYLIALGSNVRHMRHGAPRQVIEAALAALAEQDIRVECRSRVIASLPIGPSQREYANAAAVVSAPFDPPEMLTCLKAIEADFGRRRGGRRWGARVLDLDVILWDGGIWASPGLVVPHPAFRERDFVLRPAAQIAPDWRDPFTGLCVRHLVTRLTRKGTAPR